MTETREQREERVYAQAERSLETMKARRVRRGPEVVIAVLLLMTLAVAVVAALDIRRLNTPGGTALRWAGAAVFGECEAYERFSVPDGPDPRSAAERCTLLREATQRDRENSGSVGIELLSLREDGDRATGRVRVLTPQRDVSTDLPLVRRGDGWAVVRTVEVCRAVGCP